MNTFAATDTVVLAWEDELPEAEVGTVATVDGVTVQVVWANGSTEWLHVEELSHR